MIRDNAKQKIRRKESNMYAFRTEIRTSTRLDILRVADITINLYNYKEFRG